MKHFTSYLISLVLLVLVNACTSDHSKDPEPVGSEEKAKLQAAIEGKWVVESQSSRTLEGRAFLEFLSDSTFILYNFSETLTQGKFSATSGTEISLDKFGVLSDIVITQNKIKFKLTYSNSTQTISANKVNLIDSTEKTKSLSHFWSLTPEEDGGRFFNDNNDWGKTIVKVTFLFTPSGTYIGQIFSTDGLLVSESRNWRWHSSKTDRFIFWEEGEVANDDQNNVIIRQITGNTLKTQEFYLDENNVSKASNLVFKK